MMDNSKNPLNRRLEDRLADFVDQVLQGTVQSEANMTDEEELQKLKNTIVQLKTLTNADAPNPLLVKRIEKRLVHAWQAEHEQPEKTSLLEQLRKMLARPTPAFRLAVVAAVFLIMAIVASSTDLAGGLSASAGEGNLPVGWVLGIGLLLIVGAILWLRKK